MGLPNSRYIKVWRSSLYFGFCGGLAGVLVDLDHWFAYQGIQFIPLLEGRPLHLFLAIIAGCVVVYSISRLRRLVTKLVLKKD